MCIGINMISISGNMMSKSIDTMNKGNIRRQQVKDMITNSNKYEKKKTQKQRATENSSYTKL